MEGRAEKEQEKEGERERERDGMLSHTTSSLLEQANQFASPHKGKTITNIGYISPSSFLRLINSPRRIKGRPLLI